MYQHWIAAIFRIIIGWCHASSFLMFYCNRTLPENLRIWERIINILHLRLTCQPTELMHFFDSTWSALSNSFHLSGAINFFFISHSVQTDQSKTSSSKIQLHITASLIFFLCLEPEFIINCGLWDIEKIETNFFLECTRLTSVTL